MSTKSSIIASLNLPQNHTDILTYLATIDATAKDILKHTTVSNGRIYRILSELESKLLITKIIPPARGLALYSMSPFATHIQNYLNQNFKIQSQNMSSIINSLDGLDAQDSIEIIHGTKADFDHHIENFLYSAKHVQILHKHTSIPWFLYCLDQDNFFKIRNIISHSRHTGSSSNKAELLAKRDAYIDIYSKKPVTHIMSHSALVEYQQQLKTHKINIDLPTLFKKYPHVKIFVIKKLHNPFSTYISHNNVLQPLFFPTLTDKLLLLSGHEITATYQDYFNKYKEDSKPITSFFPTPSK